MSAKLRTSASLRTYTIQGRKARLHPACVESFREDRKRGLIYGPYKREDGAWYMNAEAMSLDCDICPYCSRGNDDEGPFRSVPEGEDVA